jgi:hypothetical protein
VENKKPSLLKRGVEHKNIIIKQWMKCFIIITTKAPKEVRGDRVTKMEVAR